MKNLRGFYNKAEARKASPAVSRPDLVQARNALIRSEADKRPHERKPAVFSTAPHDARIRCYRPINIDPQLGALPHTAETVAGSCYAIVSPARWAELRKQKRLDSFLRDQRESGAIVEAG